MELLRFFRVFKGDKAAAMFGLLPYARGYRRLHTRSSTPLLLSYLVHQASSFTGTKLLNGGIYTIRKSSLLNMHKFLYFLRPIHVLHVNSLGAKLQANVKGHS